MLKDSTLSMDLYLLGSLPNCGLFSRLPLPSKNPSPNVHFSTTGSVPRPFQCKATGKNSSNSIVVRRSANYQHPIWHHDYIESLKSKYVVHLVIDSFTVILCSFRIYCLIYYCPPNDKAALMPEGILLQKV